jgi:hypothetical protein
VLHVVPLAEHPLDPRALRRGPTVLRPFISPANWTYTFNVDGIVSASYDVSYCQAFRNGALEAVSAEFGSSEQLFADPIEHDVLRTLSHCLDVLAANGYLGPVSVMLALANVKGSKLTYGKDYGRGEKHRFDRDVITLPDLVLETTARPDLPRELKSLFDAMWQAAGYERSHGYDEAGVWLNEANGS